MRYRSPGTGGERALEPCLHLRAEPWLPPQKERVHITNMEHLVEIHYMLEEIRLRMIAKPLPTHRGSMASSHRGGGAPDTSPRNKASRYPEIEQLLSKMEPRPTRSYGLIYGSWSQYHSHARSHPSSYTEPHAPSHAETRYTCSRSIVALHHGAPAITTPGATLLIRFQAHTVATFGRRARDATLASEAAMNQALESEVKAAAEADASLSATSDIRD
jgi:hypothetical protein